MDSRQAEEPRPWLAVGRELDELLKRVAPPQFAELFAEFADPNRRWFFSGQGRSGLAAQMAAMRFMHLGFEVHYVGEVTAPPVRPGDSLLVISGSGETFVTVGLARIAKAEGARVVALTRAPASTLATIADTVLTVPVGQTEQFGGSLFEQSCILLLDGVVLGLAQDIPGAHEIMLSRHTNMQ